MGSSNLQTYNAIDMVQGAFRSRLSDLGSHVTAAMECSELRTLELPGGHECKQPLLRIAIAIK